MSIFIVILSSIAVITIMYLHGESKYRDGYIDGLEEAFRKE